MKKAISILLTLVMVLSLFTLSAFATGAGEVSTKAELVAAAANTSVATVKLMSDIDMGNDVLIFSRSATLDLNGHILSGTSNNSQYSVVYVGTAGILTINDTAGGGKVVSTGTYNAVGVYGQLTINAGTFEGANAAVYNYNDKASLYGTTTINGGTFIGHGDGAILNCGIMTINNSPVLNGVTGTGLDNSGSLTITGTPSISAGNTYALIMRNGVDAFAVIGSGDVALETGAQLTIQAGQYLYLDGDLTVEGTLNLAGTLEVGNDGTILNNGTINLRLGADDTWTGILTGTGDLNIVSSSEVTANADATYTVIIPASVDFGTIDKSMSSKSIAFNVSVEDALLEFGKSILVTNTTGEINMVMKDNNGTGSKTLGFTLTPGFYLFTLFNIDANGDKTITGTASCNPSELTAAGSYKGYMTFSVEYKAVS